MWNLRARRFQHPSKPGGDEGGRFAVGGIPPGEYKVFAWESIETNAWMNADFMKSYEDFGAPATIGANAKIPAQLRAIPPER